MMDDWLLLGRAILLELLASALTPLRYLFGFPSGL